MNMNTPEIEEYRGKSKLEPHLEVIIEMRAKNWPYRKILEFLLVHFGLKTSYSTLHSFCTIRDIKKNSGRNKTSLPKQEKVPIMSDVEIEELIGSPAESQNPFTKLR